MSIRKLSALFVPLAVLLVMVLAACSSATPTSEPAISPTATSVSTPVPPTTQTPSPTEALTTPATPASTMAPMPAPTAQPEPTLTPQPAVNYFENVPGIVNPTNFGWPREVEGVNGIVSIPSKPLRIITASVGHDEIALALVPKERLVGVGSSTKSVTYSNVASLVQDTFEITRDPETIVTLSPDVVVTSPFFSAEGIDALSRLGIPVVQTDLQQGPEARIDNILLMGYIFGEENRAVEFAAEVKDRYESLVSVTGAAGPKPRVLALTQYSDTIWTAGRNSTEGSVITAAGGINAAEEAGIDSNQTTSLEGVIAMSPDIIVIAQPVEFGAAEFRQSLLNNEALAEVPAIKNGQVHLVDGKHFTTLSYWNIRGAEDLANLLWPNLFPEPITTPFTLAE